MRYGSEDFTAVANDRHDCGSRSSILAQSSSVTPPLSAFVSRIVIASARSRVLHHSIHGNLINLSLKFGNGVFQIAGSMARALAMRMKTLRPRFERLFTSVRAHLRAETTPFIIWLRLDLNSDPSFHSGYRSLCATRYPIVVSNRASSTAPVRSQSGLISSVTL